MIDIGITHIQSSWISIYNNFKKMATKIYLGIIFFRIISLNIFHTVYFDHFFQFLPDSPPRPPTLM